MLSKFNTACSSVSLHIQSKTELALSLAVQGYSPIQTHYTNQMKQERREIIQFIHTHKDMFMWNETGRGVHDHHSLSKQ
jgi:hypothetical protein